MRVYLRVFTVLSMIILLGLGIYLVLFSFQGLTEPLSKAMDEGKTYFLTGGVVLLILSLAAIYSSLAGLSGEPAVTFTSPEGEVRVAFSAIEGFVKKLIHQIPEVKELKPRVCVGKKGLEIHNRVVLKSDVNVPDVTKKIQVVIGKYIRDVLGIEDIASIRIFVTRFAPSEVKEVEAEEEITGEE